MIFGRSVIHWIVVALIAICVFFVAQWLIPLLFHLVGVDIPPTIVNILSLLIAIGVFYGGYSWRGGPVAACLPLSLLALALPLLYHAPVVCTGCIRHFPPGIG